jgi:Na+-transporting NADH:ubiquinone oxidoreductase subunit C
VLYAVIFQDMALWGDVRGIIAVDKDVTTITGFDIISHNETPGLGGRIDEAAYKDQLIGEVVGPGGMIRETRTGSYDYDHTNGTIDSITGATRTSDSMVKIINNELSRLRDLLGVDE